jgi:hypothetical protein
MKGVSRGNKSSGGQIVSSDSIISGLNMAAGANPQSSTLRVLL